jgi:hypothetical protein
MRQVQIYVCGDDHHAEPAREDHAKTCAHQEENIDGALNFARQVIEEFAQR